MLEIAKSVLTAKGAALETACRIGGHIKFTKFKLGNGTYTGSETTAEIEAMTELKSPKDTFGVSGVEAENADTSKLTLVATNLDVTTGYYISELGIYAKGDDNVEVLYMVIVAQPAARDWFPAYNSRTPGSITYRVYISVGNSENVTIDVDAGGVALAADLEALEDRVEVLETGRVFVGADGKFYCGDPD